MSHKQAADLHRVKPTLVHKIMSDWKKDPNFISKRREKLKEKEDAVELVSEYTERMILKKQQILSARSVTDALNDFNGTKLKVSQVN